MCELLLPTLAERPRVADKELKLRCQNPETMLFAIYPYFPYYGNLTYP